MKFEQVKLDGVIVHNSGGKYRVKMIGTDRRVAVRKEGESSPIYFVTENQLRYYEPMDNFFRLGKRYMLGNRTDTWLVLDLYEVENPFYGRGRQKAIARMTTADGKEDIQTLNMDDFERMRLA